MKSARLLSANDVINLIFKMAPRLIKRVYTLRERQLGLGVNVTAVTNIYTVITRV